MTPVAPPASAFRSSPQQTLLWRDGLAFEPVRISLTLNGPLDPIRLRAALGLLVARHEILRSTLSDSIDGVVQQVGDPPPTHDLVSGTVSACRPFAASYSNGNDGSVLSLSAISAVADAWSLATLLAQLSAAYLAMDQAGSPETMQYADLAEGYHELLQDDTARSYWLGRAPFQEQRRRPAPLGTATPLLREAPLAVPEAWSEAKLFARWIIFQSRWSRSSKLNTHYLAPGTRQIDGIELIGPVARPLLLPFQLDWSADMATIEEAVMNVLASDLAFADHHDCFAQAPSGTAEFMFEPRVSLPKAFADTVVLEARVQIPVGEPMFHLRVIGEGRLQLIGRGCEEHVFTDAVELLRRLIDPGLQARSTRPHELVLDAGRAREVTAPGTADVVAEIAQWARHDPLRVALSDTRGTVTFAELFANACAASAALIEAGTAPGSLVALQLQRGRDWSVWWLAVWMSEATVVPLAFDLPAEQVRRRCEDLRVTHMVAVDDPAGLSAIHIPPSARMPVVDPGHRRVAVLHPAYVLSTSGSTGLPKATIVSHPALSAYLSWARTRYGTDGGHGALVASDATFDFTQTSLWLPLMAGETVHFAPPDLRVHQLSALMRQLGGLAFLKLTPTHLQVLSQMEAAGEPPPPWPAHVIVGGEALTGAMLPASLRRSRAIVHNEYGPTEATVGCCVQSTPADGIADGTVPIGCAVPGTQLLVMEEDTGEGHGVGELLLSGEQLALGYLGDPRRTAANFLPHPHPSHPGERCYRTGDRVSRESAGWIFLGRGDDTVKRNGVRIELHSLTSRLLHHPHVTGCHTFARISGNIDQPSVICAVTGTSLDAGDLRDWLAVRMPARELPNRIAVVAHLPCTPQGKVDQAALEYEIDNDVAAAPPMTADEAVLASIWRRVLGTQRILPSSHFFVEGGDSIRAISVAVEARRDGLPLAADDLFKWPVLRDLAASLPARSRETHATRLDADGQPGLDRLPVSQLQMGMIFHNQSHRSDGRYHDIFSYKLQLETFDEACLREAACRLVARHSALRTTFDLARGEPMQVIWPEGPDVLAIADLQGQPPDVQEATVQAWIATERAQGFDTAVLPLLRFMVHRLDPRTIQFNVSFHHAIMDGWSDQQIHTELFQDYRRLLRGEARDVERFDSRFRDFVAAEREALQTPAIAQYWQDYLDGAPPMLLGDDPGQDPQSVPATPLEHRHELSASQADALACTSRITGEPVSVLLLAAHLATLRIMTGQSDVVSAYVANCRLDGEHMERSVGLFINTLPIRVAVDGGRWNELVTRVGDAQREAFLYRRLPYAQIARMAGEAATPSSLFYFTHFHNGIDRTDELTQFGRQAHEVTSFPLTASFNLCPQSGRLSYTLAFSRKHFSAPRAAQFVACYEATMASLAHDANYRLPESASVPGLVLSSREGAPAVTAGTWLEQLAMQIRERPDAPAASDHRRTLTFAQLDRHASRIARGLHSRGIRPGDAVATLLPRGTELVTALVGVARAGAVFVAIDANEPPARRDHIALGARLVLVGTEVPADLPAAVACVGLDDLAVESGADGASALPRIDWPAYRMYTSGSSGVPKCVEVGHGNYATVLSHFREVLRPSPGDRIMQTTASSFDIGMLEYGLALTSGATLVVLDPEAAVTPDAYAPGAGFKGRTLLQATPSLWSVLRLRGFKALPRLTALVGGEPMPTDLREWLNGHAEQVWNVYGPTETTIWSTAARVDGAPLTIGEPISGTQVHLLDADLAPLPQGSPGMIHIGGDGVSIGYVGDARATAAAFVPDPFSDLPGSRMYRTGDLGCMDAEGRFLFIGRVDTQVKISGHRLEITEIESRLRAHPAIEEAVVIAPKDPDDGLSAYLLYASGAARPHAHELRTWLASHLPPYAVPRRYGSLREIPHTPNGKLDRRRVADAAVVDLDATEMEPPRDDLESVLLKLWSKVLKSESIGATTDFLTVGGYSLTAVRIVAQLRDLFGVDVPGTKLFVVTTVRDLAGHLRTAYPQAEVDRKASILAKVIV